MKIDDMIKKLQRYRKQFGNLEICIPETTKTETYNMYRRKTEFKEPALLISNVFKDKLCVVMDIRSE